MFYLPGRRGTSPFAGIPGPRPVPLLGNAHRFLGNPPWRMKPPWLVCESLARDFGDLTLIWLLGRPTLILNHPDLIEQVLVTDHEQFFKDDPIGALKPLTPEHSLFLSNGDEWRRLRENHPCSVPEFKGWLDRQVPLLADGLRNVADRLAERTATAPIDMMQSLQRATFDLFATAILGERLGDRAYRDFCFMGRTGARRMQMPVQPAPPLDPRFYTARRRWNRTLADAMDRGGVAGREDLLSRYPRNNSPLSGDALRVLLGNMFYGGVFSATSCLVSTLRLLQEYPDVAKRLDAQWRDQIGDQPVSLAVLDRCRFLDFVVRESLRVQPPVPIFMRCVGPHGPAKLAGRTIPAGTSLAICPWLLHRSPSHWDDPERFVPDRWSGGVAEQNPLGSRWFFPFGRGPRMCVGMDFAMAYIKLAVAVLRSQAKWRIHGQETWKPEFFFGVMIPRGLTLSS